MIHQLRTQSSRYKVDTIIEFLESSFQFIQSRSAEDILIDIAANGRQWFYKPIWLTSLYCGHHRMHLTAEGATSISGYNTTLGIQRNDNGQITGIGESEFRTESILRFEIDGIPQENISQIKSRITASLNLARSMVKDFEHMTSEVERTTMRFARKTQYEPDQRFRYNEVADFLRWLQQENFVFMGVHTESDSYDF